MIRLILTTSLLLVLSVSVVAQDDLYSSKQLSGRPIDLTRSDTVLHFFQSSGDIVWQNVYECPQTAEEILSHFANLRIFDKVKADSNTLQTKRIRDKVNFKALGISQLWGGNSLLVGFPFEHNVQIEAKDGRYRVTLSRITFFPDVNIGLNSSWTSVSNNTNSMYRLDLVYNFKRHRFSSQFRERDAVVLDRVFLGDFDINTKQSSAATHSDEW